MKLASEFIQLPLRLDIARLQLEVSSFEEHEWGPHPQGYALFELLQQNMEMWTIGDESHAEFESIRSLHPARRKILRVLCCP